MAKVTIRKLTGERGWVISQGQEWHVEAPTFEEAAFEAMFNGMMYGSQEAVLRALARRRRTDGRALS